MSDNLMLDIKLDPIRKYAQAFGMSKPLPKTPQEFVALLYEFGFNLNGGMEQMLEHAMKVQSEMALLSNLPIIVRREDVPFG